MTIVIRTTAEYGGEGGLPDTGDTSGIAYAALTMVGSMVGLLMVLLPKKPREKENAK